jgi:ABC-type transporter Mla MlaB component
VNDLSYNVASVLRVDSAGYNSEMLRITTENRRGKLFLTVEGSLSGPRVATLEQCWRELYSTAPRPKFCVNLCGVSFIDNAGKVLLKEMHRLGAELLAEGCLNQAIVNEIAGPKEKAAARESKDNEDAKGSPIIFYLILFSLLLAPALCSAQTKQSLSQAHGDFAHTAGPLEKTYAN